MIQFNKRCEVCGMPIHGLNAYEIDGHVVCITHFRMLLTNGYIHEGMDDEWHFLDNNEANIKKILELLKLL